jgi:glycerol-3-phosphate responsive antiterminator
MNMKEELTKLLMESYAQGVADAKKAAITAIERAIILEREACAKVCEDLEAWNMDDPGSSAAAAIRARGNT